MNAFFVALNAVFPFLIYLGLGYSIRLTGYADEAFFRRLNRIIFIFFFSVLTFTNIYNIDRDVRLNPRVALFGAGGVILSIVVLMIVIPRIVPGNARRGAVIQACYRSNYVLYAMPIAASVCGEAGTDTAAMLVAIIVPLFNLTAVFVLAWFSGEKPSPRRMIADIATNPLIDGALVGFLFRTFGILLPEAILGPLNSISAMSTPIALIVLGGTLRFSSVRKNLRWIILTCMIKLILLPAAAIAILLPAGFPPVERFVLFLIFAAPVATASFTMAQNMGSDGELAGELVAITTAASLFTLFSWIFLFGNLGLLA